MGRYTEPKNTAIAEAFKLACENRTTKILNEDYEISVDMACEHESDGMAYFGMIGSNVTQNKCIKCGNYYI